MEALIDKLMKVSLLIVFGLMMTHPFTWRMELIKLEHSMLREAIRTDNWGRLPVLENSR